MCELKRELKKLQVWAGFVWIALALSGFSRCTRPLWLRSMHAPSNGISFLDGMNPILSG